MKRRHFNRPVQVLLLIFICLSFNTPLHAEELLSARKDVAELLEWLKTLRDRGGVLGRGLKSKGLPRRSGKDKPVNPAERPYGFNFQDFETWTTEKLVNTRVLDLNGLVIKDFGKLRHLRHLKKLRTLQLSCSGASGNLSFLRQLPDLMHLELVRSGVTDKDLAELSGLKKLIEINLAECPISDEGVMTLARITSLRDIQLGRIDRETDRDPDTVPHRGFTEASVKMLAGMPHLKYLILSRFEDPDILKVANAIRQQRPFMDIDPGFGNTTGISGIVTRYGHPDEENLWRIGQWHIDCHKNVSIQKELKKLEFAHVRARGVLRGSCIFPDSSLRVTMFSITGIEVVSRNNLAGESVQISPAPDKSGDVDPAVTNRTKDSVHLFNGDHIHGILSGLDDTRLAWRYIDNSDPVYFDRKAVVLISPASSKARNTTGDCQHLLYLSGGERLPCSVLELGANKVVVKLWYGEKANIDRGLVSRISVIPLSGNGKVQASDSSDTVVTKDSSITGKVNFIKEGKLQVVVDGKPVDIPVTDVQSVMFRQDDTDGNRPAMNARLFFITPVGASVGINLTGIKDGIVSGNSPVLGKFSLKLSSFDSIRLAD